MVGDILVEFGDIFLGSRLKRLAERLHADAAKIIRDCGFDFQPSQVTLLAAVDRYGPLTVTEAVAALGVSQPAATRSMAGLIDLGLLETSRSGADQRHKTMTLTPLGAETMARTKAAIWPGVGEAVREISAGLSGSLLDQIAGFETALAQASLDERFRAKSLPSLSLVEYSEELAGTFHDINAEWISSMYAMEATDRDVLQNPTARIIDHGGAILFVAAAGLGIVGACALKNSGEGCFELTKMGVLESARGRKAGEFLLARVIERAATMPIKTLYLLTNSKSQAAIHLYEKLGFVHDEAIMQRFGRSYERCNVAMSYPLRPAAAAG